LLLLQTQHKLNSVQMQQPTAETQAVWVALMRVGPIVLDAVEAAAKRAGFPTLAAYDVLWGIERSAEGALRPRELARQLLFPRYGLSRLLDRLERDGLISREICPDDARGQLIRLTAAGRALRARMWPIYAAAMIDAVEARLTGEEASLLAALLGKLG
jgi:DNA-binding MarR family transcriptional regulator